MIYLTKEQIIEINAYAIKMVGGINYGVLNDSALDMIVQMPQQIIFGKELYPTAWLKVSFLLQKTTKQHIFSGGNKRTSIQELCIFIS